MSKLLRTKQVSKMLGVSRSTLINFAIKDEIEYEYFSLGGCGYLFSEEKVMHFIQKLNTYFTVEETAELLHMHKNDLLPLCRSGEITRVKLFGKWRYKKVLIYAYSAKLQEQQKHRYFFLSVYQEVKTKMKLLKFTYSDIATHLGVSTSLVNKWMTQKLVPSEKRAKQLLTLFGFEPEKTVI